MNPVNVCRRLPDIHIANVRHPNAEHPYDMTDHDQRRILRDIDTTTQITASETDWAVNAGYAVLAEDGDIDLTAKGRAVLDAA